MTWEGVATKKNKPKKDKDDIIIIVRHVIHFQRLAGFGFMK